MNGATLLAGYLLIGAGISLTTAPPGVLPISRVIMAVLWAPIFVAAVVALAFDRSRDL